MTSFTRASAASSHDDVSSQLTRSQHNTLAYHHATTVVGPHRPLTLLTIPVPSAASHSQHSILQHPPVILPSLSSESN
ncbi:hypothetical protein CGRA01v4_06210 [Colletotrichum graminicola]|nr:hypothetical protein CGRA01v4_06210 [Colletotrichum graminicola]